MKIKTIWTASNFNFDEKVNRLLEEGWLLGKRDVFLDTEDLDNSVFYAELVQLDEADKLPAEPVDPAPVDPLEALRDVREFCDTTRECTEDCRLYAFCNKHLPSCEGPADWDLPGEEGAK